MTETWRRVGAIARDLDLSRPSYDSIRLIVGPHRERQRAMRELAKPAIGGFLTGRITQWDVDRLWEASAIAARDRRARRR